MPSRDTCVHAPPTTAVVWWLALGFGLSRMLWSRLEVCQAPITGSLQADRQDLCTSTACEGTLASSMVFGTALISAGFVITDSGALTRSKIVPSLTAKA